MDRRSFFRLGAAALASAALKEAIPFGRVWSFPSKIVFPELPLAFHPDAFKIAMMAPKCPYTGPISERPYIIFSEILSYDEFAKRYPPSAHTSNA